MYLDRRFYEDLAPSFLDWYRDKVENGSESIEALLKDLERLLVVGGHTNKLPSAVKARTQKIEHPGIGVLKTESRQLSLLTKA